MGKYEINLINYYNNYKDILQSCYNKGMILPVLLNDIYVPSEYSYSEKDMKHLMDNLSNKNKDSIKKEYVARRKLEREYISKYSLDESLEMWDKFKDKEFKVFLEEFPKFKSIVD